MVFKNLCVPVLWKKVASALEGLYDKLFESGTCVLSKWNNLITLLYFGEIFD